jgi:type VI protein secretion system component Hcp
MGFDAFIKFDGIEMEYTLSNCIVSSISTESDSGEFPVDEIALNFGGIQWRYTQQSRTGGRAVGNIATGWSLEKNCRA